MAGEMFGGPAGSSQAIGDQNVLSQTQARDAMLPGALQLQQEQILDAPVDRQYKKGQIWKQPAEVISLLANAGKDMAEAGLKDAALREANTAAEIMSKYSQGADPEGDPADVMLNMMGGWTKALMKGGATATATKVLNQYEQMYSHVANKKANDAKIRHQEHLEQNDKLQDVGRVLNGITNQETADQAARQWIKKYKEPAPFASENNPLWALPYHPEWVQKMQNETLTYNERLATENKDDNLAVREAHFKRLQELDRVQNNIKQQLLDLAKEKADRAKLQGGHVREPSQRMVDDASNFIISEDERYKGLKGIDKKLFAVVSKDVAYEAQKIHDKNPAIRYEQALVDAWEGQRQNLEIIAPKIPGTDWDNPLGSPTLKRKVAGAMSGQGTKDSPITVGPGFDPRTVQEGKYYIKDGKLGVAKNGRMELVQ